MKNLNDNESFIDETYRNRKNKKFGYTYIPDAEVFDIKNKIIQNPKKYDYSCAENLSSQLNQNIHPSALEEFIIILKEIDKNNLTKWQETAKTLLKKFKEFEYCIYTQSFYKK